MKEINDENRTEQSSPGGHSRRDFIVSAATAVASVGAANLLNLQPAQGANATNSAAIGDGPYPTEGMAAYSPTGPHELMKFQRRALGPKDVAIKIHYCGICHSDIHTVRGDWGKIQYPQIVGHELAMAKLSLWDQVSASS
jgi:alcohol dehydrogenase (NADP+)